MAQSPAGLNRSASDPGLRQSNGGSSGSLRAAGAGLAGSNNTTSLYEKLKGEGKFRDFAPRIPPAGRSTIVPMADSAERDLQSEIYFALPPTPVKERRFRRTSHNPGEIHVHHGLKDQKLPGEAFRYGIPGVTGCTTEDTLKAGQLFGVAEYKNRVAENVYESTKKEPLGKPHVRGHTLKMSPGGFGVSSGVPVDSKKLIFPIDSMQDTEEMRAQYRKTHNSYQPGERVTREYNWPEEAKDPYFRFGAQAANAVEGAGASMALNYDMEDDGTYKKTRLVQKVCEDYRDVQHPKLFEKTHPKQGANGPPVHVDTRFGIKSSTSDYTAASCIKGYYSLKEQLPDQDLGRCTKPGRRNVTTEMRAFGVPSVRTDVPAPHPDKRSLADTFSYGDECSAAALLNPQPFDSRGVADREFLIRRPKAELEALVENVGLPEVDFEELWEHAFQLFDDGLELVSLDAMLYVYSQKVDESVRRRHETMPMGIRA